MLSRKSLPAAVAALVIAAGACSDLVDPTVNDLEVAEDLAASSAEAVGQDIADMIANEAFGGFSLAAAPGAEADPQELTITRTRTCFDAGGNQQAECNRETTASMRVQLTIDGTRQTDNFSMIVHRTRDMVISGLLGQETSRTHNGVGTSNDTTTMTRRGFSRKVEESSRDSVLDVVFNLPHETNPWPVSGQIIRNVNATVTVTGPDRTETRTISRRIVVTFPPDAQGNVTVQIGDVTCTFNLVTRRVANCTG